MKNSIRQTKKAAKARLSGAIPSDTAAKNKKIVFGDDESFESGSADEDRSNEDRDGNEHSDNDDDDDSVEEVKGSAARESTQKLRAAERKMAKESVSKKRRKKTIVDARASNDDRSSGSESEDEKEDDILTEDFFNKVDSERADQLTKAMQQRKAERVQQKKRLGKHTTFVVEDEHKMVGEPHKFDQNIEVVAIGGGAATDPDGISADDDRQLLTSVTLGSTPSAATIAFARGSMLCGPSKERSSVNRKRRTKNEETWKRSKKLNTLGIGSRPGRAAVMFRSNK
ncbi:hypothetical protein ACHAWF_009416 [Thalassiosira exigua]